METGYAAFADHRCVASGDLADVAVAVKDLVDLDPSASILVFDDATGRLVDLDLRGTRADVVTRLREAPSTGRVGRPKLGVIGREVTLLDRHWAWLGAQPGGASAALRRLVDAARHANEGRDRIRRSQEVAHHFMTAVAGDLPGYEEALRALFAGDRTRFESQIAPWPPDVRRHATAVATDAFAEPAKVPA